MPSYHKKCKGIVVIDTKTLEVEAVYVRMSLRTAMIHFVRTLSPTIDPMYSDAERNVHDAMDRYQFVTTEHVMIGR